MQQLIRLATVVIAAIALVQFSGAAMAQHPVKQVKLSEKHIEGFISAQKDMAAAAEKVQATPPSCDKVDASLEGVAKKHGFASFCEYDDVAANISMVMAGIDPQSKQFTEPQAAIKKEIEEVTADKSIPEKEKKQMLEELNEALKNAQPIQHPSNVDLVKKYWDKIDAVLQ